MSLLDLDADRKIHKAVIVGPREESDYFERKLVCHNASKARMVVNTDDEATQALFWSVAVTHAKTEEHGLYFCEARIPWNLISVWGQLSKHTVKSETLRHMLCEGRNRRAAVIVRLQSLDLIAPELRVQFTRVYEFDVDRWSVSDGQGNILGEMPEG